MGLLDFLKDKFGSAGSGTVTKETEVTTYQVIDTTNKIPVTNTPGEFIRAENINLVNIPNTAHSPDINYAGINAKAEMAKQLKDNLLFNAILDELKEFNLVQLLNTKEGEKEAREDLYRKVRTIDDIRAKIEKYIKNAESVKRREEAKKENYGVV